MASGQQSIEGFRVTNDLETKGFTWIEHGIPTDIIDEAIYRYAVFTDELPDPSLETVSAMLPASDDPEWIKDRLDDLQYEADQEPNWHKYRTNHPAFAKPAGYTNRSLQVQALEVVRGIEIADDPKEYYHYLPGNTAKMNEMHQRYGWGLLPPEVHNLHAALLPIHRLGAAAIIKAYSALEETHPELISRHFGPQDIEASPVRLLFYHLRKLLAPVTPDAADDKKLAGGHSDKDMSTLQLADSHHGFWIKNPVTGELEFVEVGENQGAFFVGKKFSDKKIGVYPDSTIKPGWHGVDRDGEPKENRKLCGSNVARYAFIWFANSLSAGTVLDKRLTHTDEVDLSHLEDSEELADNEAVA